MNCFDERHGGKTFTGNRLFRHAPHTGDVLAMLRIGNVAVSGQLVALLPLLASALAVALAGDHGVAAAFTADATAGDDEVNGGDAILDALAMVLDAACVQQEAGGCRAPQLRRAHYH